MKQLTACLLLLFSLSLTGQIEVRPLDKDKLPKELVFKGRVKDAVQWADKAGNNMVITTETGEYASKSGTDGYKDAELFAHHFISENGVFKQTWKVVDFTKECPLDLEATFIKNTFQVTDLNKDSIAEIWLMYKTVCHGDVSPCEMKVIMYEGNQKYAMRGQNRVEIDKNKFLGGEYTFDKAFMAGPQVFREHAKDLWSKNIRQVWE